MKRSRSDTDALPERGKKKKKKKKKGKEERGSAVFINRATSCLTARIMLWPPRSTGEKERGRGRERRISWPE